jgi:acyl-CoA synthetase (NDP forming)
LELVDVACALVHTKGELKKQSVCVISDAGGPGVMLADELNRQGFAVPTLQEQTQARLVKALPPGASVSNPIDCMPTRNGEMISQVLQIVCEEESDTIDCILFMVGDSRLTDNWEIFQALIQAIDTCKLPIMPSFCSAISSHEALDRFRQAGLCYFEDEVSMARALSRVVKRPRLTEAVTEIAGYDREKIEVALAGQSGALSPTLTRQVLTAAGLRFPAQVELAEKDDLETVSTPFPWVMKVIGPLHKSDLGGVRVGVPDLATAGLVWDELMAIEDASGCLVQQIVTGPEVLIGANREPDFGHLIGFGLGGIYTEAYNDVKFKLAPLSNEEANDMLYSIRSLAILEGVRGEAGIDIECLHSWLVKISLLVTDFPHIRELDLNPVKGSGDDIYVVDARIIVD